jgi:2-polyprenyl-3-methyl-5-hydroxy-6-metoxy-1,4-benzoquinol methylase
VLRRCDDCGTAITDGSQPTEDLHDSGAFRVGTPRLHALAGPLLDRFDARRLELLGRLAPPGARVLDAGAGQGRFVAAARRAGYDALLWHVLEHLDRPAAALERIAGWLAPSGGLLLGLPNLASWQARLGGERWFHLDVPRHRTHSRSRG